MPSRKKHLAKRYHVRAVDRALALLRTFLACDTELTATEISKEMGLDPSTTFRMLVTLEAQGFVGQDPATGKYHLGVTCLELGSRFLANNDIRKRALGALEDLREDFGETAHLAVLDDTEVVYLEKLASLHPIGFMSSRVGGRAPAHCTGLGKALLAYLPDEELGRRFRRPKLTRYTEFTITDLDTLRAELAKVRERGCAIDQQEHELGVKCVAVPIFHHKGIAAAISISGPVERMDQHIERRGLIKKLQQTGTDVSTQMGWGRGADQLGSVRIMAPAHGKGNVQGATRIARKSVQRG